MEYTSEANLVEILTLRKIIDDGDICYRNDKNQLHRIHGPAFICYDGSTEWWQNGQLHRDDGPALEYAVGTKVWYQYGYKHRIGGPARIWVDGTKEWWENGKFIRSEPS